jgi:hypothetical protein
MVAKGLRFARGLFYVVVGNMVDHFFLKLVRGMVHVVIDILSAFTFHGIIDSLLH